MLTVRQVAERLNISRNTVLRMIARGELPGARKLGGPGTGRKEWRIPTTDIDNYLGSRTAVTLLTDPTKPKNISLEAAIERERKARLAMPGGYHYWQIRGDRTPPTEEHFCSHCGGWYGVLHTIGEGRYFTHNKGELCRFAFSLYWCACIDCCVARATR